MGIRNCSGMLILVTDRKLQIQHFLASIEYQYFGANLLFMPRMRRAQSVLHRMKHLVQYASLTGTLHYLRSRLTGRFQQLR